MTAAAPDLARALLDARADAQAAVALVVEQAAGIVRSVWGRCEALEDEAADKLANPEKLTEHEQGFWRGQKMVAKSIRRSIEMPLAPADGLAAVEALRKERDDALELAEERLRGQHRLSNQLNDTVRDLSAELAAAQQREAKLREAGARLLGHATQDMSEQMDAWDAFEAALSHNGRKGE